MRLDRGLGGSRVAELSPTGLLSGEGSLAAGRDEHTILLRQSGVKMQHEGGGISAEFRDDERNAMRHQTADEMYVAGQAVELRDEDRTLLLASLRECRGELWAAVERVRA